MPVVMPPTRDDLTLLTRELRLARGNLGGMCDRVAALQQRLRADASTIVSLDKLNQRRHPVTPLAKPQGHVNERFEGDEASLGIDAWEISLINEEG
jgi:hypothetical protein